MANEFTNESVRNAVAFIPTTTTEMRFSDAEAEKFDEWLAAHDAGVKAAAMEETLTMFEQREFDGQWYMTRSKDDVRSAIRRRAGEYREQAN